MTLNPAIYGYMYYRPALASLNDIVGVIYSVRPDSGSRYVYEYNDWWDNAAGAVARHRTLKTAMDQVDTKLANHGYELLTEEEANKLLLLI